MIIKFFTLYSKYVVSELRLYHTSIMFYTYCFRSILKTSINRQQSGLIEFDSDGILQISHYKILNLIHDEKRGIWKNMGYIKGTNVSMGGIIWPGDNKLGTIVDGKKKYRIATTPVKPFVMDEIPHEDYGECFTSTPCLATTTTEKAKVIDLIQDYDRKITNESNPYQIRCCQGLTIDLLNKLAIDMNFDFTLYIVNDSSYGKKVEGGKWDGMVRDLRVGTAHMAFAAFSITNTRIQAIDFTDPYFYSGFSVLYADREKVFKLYAFLEPFDISVWVAIFISATICAVAMALFEWNSPFGLNPWGRKRKQNYTLASGLTMVYSVLFGHTVKTKSPKSWPSKVMQNFWASAAIFIIASYTANLAAYIAGKNAGRSYNNIYDPKVSCINNSMY